MLMTTILAVALGQAPAEARWYTITNRPGWEGYGVPARGELRPLRWRRADDRGREWVKAWQEVTTAPTAAVQPAAPAGDPYGFLGWLNATRAAYGLQAVGYDPNLEAWAMQNSQQQAASGIGHYTLGSARLQNSAFGSAENIGPMWLGSPAHRAALLDPSARWIGLAVYGGYWTLNLN